MAEGTNAAARYTMGTVRQGATVIRNSSSTTPTTPGFTPEGAIVLTQHQEPKQSNNWAYGNGQQAVVAEVERCDVHPTTARSLNPREKD